MAHDLGSIRNALGILSEDRKKVRPKVFSFSPARLPDNKSKIEDQKCQESFHSQNLREKLVPEKELFHFETVDSVCEIWLELDSTLNTDFLFAD